MVLGTVGLDGSLRRIPGVRGLLSTVEPSPNGELAVVTRIERPFSRLVPARRFPRSLEVWDLKRAARIRAHPVPETEGIRQLVWKPGRAASLGWVERTATLPAGVLGRVVRLDFFLDSDQINGGPGWYLDDVDVRGE